MATCPVCRSELTSLLLRSETEIDYCNTCKGLWVDHEELGEEHSQDPVLQAVSELPLGTAILLRCPSCGGQNPRIRKTCRTCEGSLTLNCPRCGEPLSESRIGSLALDRCPKQHGVWLDGGELTLLFREFHRIKAAQTMRKYDSGTRASGQNSSAELFLDPVSVTLDTLIWAPDLLVRTGMATGELARHMPEMVDGALEAVSHVPEVAGKVADVSGDLIQGSIDLVSHIPDAAGAATDLLSAFIEALLGLISD